MAGKTEQDIEAAVKEELQHTIYAISSLRSLSGGFANFVYHAKLQNPLADGTVDVVVKHSEAYVAKNSDFALTMTRCQIEEECLRLLSRLPHSITPAFEVGTPRLFHFDPKTSTQIQEYLPAVTDLKHYALERYSAPTPESLKSQCLQLGRALGNWLLGFHDWGQQPANSSFRDVLAKNTDMQNIKRAINYDQLLQMVGKYPKLLGDCKDVLQQVVDMAASELQDDAKLRVIHGDFWTGNVLLPDSAIDDGKQVPLKIVDWEMAQLGLYAEDLGQLIAELWQLKLYKDIDAGLWIIQGFLDGYGKLETDLAFRALIHTGAHLICIGATTPGWGTPEKNEKIAEAGRDVILNAWDKNRESFEGHDLELIFQ